MLVESILFGLAESYCASTGKLLYRNFKEISLMRWNSKRSFHEDVLGIGLYVERHKKSDKLKTISSPLDLISKTAFLEDELRSKTFPRIFPIFKLIFRLCMARNIPLLDASSNQRKT